MPLPHAILGLLVHMKPDAYVVIPDGNGLAGVWFEQLIGVSGLNEANDLLLDLGLLLGKGPAADVRVGREVGVGVGVGVGIGVGEGVGEEEEVL